MDNLLNLIQILGKHLHDEITIRKLSLESKVPYTTTLRIINQNKNLFMIRQKGNIKLISLNLDDAIIKNYLILSERKTAEKFLEKESQFKILKDEFPKGNYSVVLFGSRAEGTQRTKSDIDLCIINDDGKKNIKFSKFELLFKLEINPLVLKKTEFKQMLKEKEHNLSHEIIKKHIILYGEEYFWNIVWDEIKNGI
jgi:predicted nucleotidyltransferase